MQKNQLLLHLSLIENIGSTTIAMLIEGCRTQSIDLLSLYSMNSQQIMSLGAINQKRAQAIVQGLADATLITKELDLLKKYAINYITLEDEQYPALLKNIYAPPAVLYVQGNVHCLADPSIAIVGSRKANSYGHMVIQQLVGPLISQGLIIVSGGALGADTMAHQATVDLKSKTIAVLGSGLLRPYPTSNRALFESILACGGALVSPFSLMMEALPGNFPARNRIIAGLSQGCVVIQAALKSGARITALFALEQGRDVFAVPGPVSDPLSEGCHQLIKEGATLISNVNDILLGLNLPSTVVGKKVIIEQPRPMVPVIPVNADIIIELCKNPISFDDLLEKSNYTLSALHNRLFELHIDGMITQNVMGLWHCT